MVAQTLCMFLALHVFSQNGPTPIYSMVDNKVAGYLEILEFP
jgi:hypothetical protein